MIDLLVVNYNTKSKLERLIRHLWDDVVPERRPWKLYIQDNGSTDGSGEWLREHEDLCDRVIYADNVGYAAACNHLAAISDSPILGLLNADVWLSTSDVYQLEYAYTDPSTNILGPKQRNEEGKITHAGIFGSNTHPKHRAWMQPDIADLLYKDELEAVTVSGAAYFVRRDCWDALTNCPIYQEMFPGVEGAFLPTVHYYEETGTSYHAHAHGMSVRYNGTISIGHTWHASSEMHSEADKQMPISQKVFRSFCASHGIQCD